MNAKLVEEVANAVLYEGYILYPYRASAIKNRQRWNFGVVYPRVYAEQQSGADAWSMQTECLVKEHAKAVVQIRIRCLHLIAGTLGDQPWQQAMEREIHVGRGSRQPFEFQPIENQWPIEGVIVTESERIADDVLKVRVRLENTTPFDGATRDQALMQSLVSAHTILNVEGGEFVSLLEPPDELRELAAACQNIGTWPVLAGEDGERDCMLSSPIILYDYPKIAPESPGALFDGTEIDEILTLRIMTLTDQEKLEMGLAGEHAREILERTESMPPEQFMKMHGVLRGVDRRPETP